MLVNFFENPKICLGCQSNQSHPVFERLQNLPQLELFLQRGLRVSLGRLSVLGEGSFRQLARNRYEVTLRVGSVRSAQRVGSLVRYVLDKEVPWQSWRIRVQWDGRKGKAPDLSQVERALNDKQKWTCLYQTQQFTQLLQSLRIC